MSRIALDAMSSECGIDSCAHGAWLAWRKNNSLQFIVYGHKPSVEPVFKRYFKNHASRVLRFMHTEEVILQSESPSLAIRKKKDSSTHGCIKSVQEGLADGAVSCANSGATVALGRYFLKRMPGIDRIAFTGSFPTYHPEKDTYLCDIGATVDPEAKHLHQHARFMSEYLRSPDLPNPAVGILNNGTEEMKGNKLVHEAVELIQNDPALNYKGYAEGSGIFSGDFDIVVCDGFVGNAVLKSCEESARFIMHTIKGALSRSLIGNIIALPLKYVLENYAARLRPSARNGALVLGLQGVLVKGHGRSDAEGFATAIEICHRAIKSRMIETMKGLHKTVKVKEQALT